MPAIACVDTAVSIGLPRFHPSLPDPIPPPNSTTTTTTPWSTDLSSSLYNIPGWGFPYFSVNASGNISITLPHQEIDLLKVVEKASNPRSSGGLALQLPLIVRFPGILKDRLESLNSAFKSAVQFNGYRSHYQGVYPVKCNQDRYIVEDIVEIGYNFRFGLEAGSKPEILLAMACLAKGNPESFLVCNGYKDREYISLALLGRKLNLNTIIVLEQEEELDTVIETSKKLGVSPIIGIRAKLRTKHSGHFGSTSGENGKFGLTATQILSVVKKLQNHEMLDCLQLLHFHIGSQIPSTALLSDGVTEAAQIYCELAKLGASMRVIDVGGGLGIDYDGSHSGNSDMSVAYSLGEYASSVVQSIQIVCDKKHIPHPIICSESGRALISHHSVLIFEAISSTTNPNLDDPSIIHADKLKRTCLDRFKDGSLSLKQLAGIDALCDLAANKFGRATNPVHTYHVNLSVFTSIPDFWAFGQLFPIIPIHRLDQKPKFDSILSDLTCDSDGKIDKFIGDKRTLPLHEIGSGAYYLGMFLGGAYQEALGGTHNLFGGPSVVRVLEGAEGGFTVVRTAARRTCGDVLRGMGHVPKVMAEALRRRSEDCGGKRGDGGVARELARAFGSMPYLVRELGGGEVEDDGQLD